MAFEQVQTLDADNVIQLGGSNRKTGEKNPTQVEGYYLGSRKVESKKSKNGYANLHFFQTEKGNLGVWGKTDLDRKLTTVATGTMVRATATGTKSTPNGDMYTYKVEQDKDNTIEVNFASNEETGSGNDSEQEDSYDSSSEGTSTDEDGSGYDDDHAALAQAAAERAARKAAVEARLNGRNKKA